MTAATTTSKLTSAQRAARLGSDPSHVGPTGPSPAEVATGLAMLQRAQQVGVVGALILGLSATAAGALPIGDPSEYWWLTEAERPLPHLSLVGAYLGLTLIVGAWLALGGAIRRQAAGTRDLVITLVAWAAPLVLAPPLYSRDVYSYVAQGAMFRDGFDPYRFGAAAYGGPLAENVSQFWQNSTAPYGPVFLAITAIVMALAGDDVVVGVLGMRLVMLVGLAVTAVLVLRLARRYRADEPTALWLAVLNPLVLFHVVSGAHNDILIVALLLAAMLLAGTRKPFLAAALIGIAVLVKASAVVALLFVVPAAARRIGGRYAFAAGAVTVGAAAAVTMGVITIVTGGRYGWVTALVDTTRVHNGLSLSTDVGMFLTWLTDTLDWSWPVDPTSISRTLAMAAAGALLLTIMARTRGKPVLGLGLALVMLVVLGPVVHPWYVLWGFIPLAAVAHQAWSLRLIVWASAAFAFYPMPSGGGPTGSLVFGLLGVIAGAIACWLWLSDTPDHGGPGVGTSRGTSGELTSATGLSLIRARPGAGG